MKQRHILKVIKRDGKWTFKSNKIIEGWTLYDPCKSKAQAIDTAFKYAKKIKGAIVRIFSAEGKLQVEADHKAVLTYVKGD